MIRYMPKLDSPLWSRKSLEYFDTVEDLKAFISHQRTRFCRFIGKPEKFFLPEDVTLADLLDDLFMGWNHYRTVTIDGITVGYCGE